jgi:hypothetical protein
VGCGGNRQPRRETACEAGAYLVKWLREVNVPLDQKSEVAAAPELRPLQLGEQTFPNMFVTSDTGHKQICTHL